MAMAKGRAGGFTRTLWDAATSLVVKRRTLQAFPVLHAGWIDRTVIARLSDQGGGTVMGENSDGFLKPRRPRYEAVFEDDSEIALAICIMTKRSSLAFASIISPSCLVRRRGASSESPRAMRFPSPGIGTAMARPTAWNSGSAANDMHE
jgi:hypothetical protein